MAWQPEDGTLRQLAGYLSDTLNSYNQAARKNAEQVRPSIAVFLNSGFFSIARYAWLGTIATLSEI